MTDAARERELLNQAQDSHQQAAAAAAVKAQANAQARAEADAVSRPEDEAAADMPAFEMPALLASNAAILKQLDSALTDDAHALASASASAGSVDYANETPRERELRLRDAKARLKTLRKMADTRRGGKAALERARFTDPPVFHGDETASEIATRPALIREHVKRYAEWLMEGARGTLLLEDARTCPENFALVFRFDTTNDPVARAPRSKLGSQVDVLLASYKRVVYWLWSDYADGIVRAALNKTLDVVLAPHNVLAVLPGGVKPSGLGERVGRLEELARVPILSCVTYPGGIPSELVLEKKRWGDDLCAPISAAASATAAWAAADALDSDDEADAAPPLTFDDDDDDMAKAIKTELRALGARRFPLSALILEAFKPQTSDVPEAKPSASAASAAFALEE